MVSANINKEVVCENDHFIHISQQGTVDAQAVQAVCVYLSMFIRLALALDVKFLHHFEVAVVRSEVKSLPAKL